MRLSIPIYQLKRQAKQRSRQDGVALNVALNSIAKREGYENWSLLASRYAERRPATKILNALEAGDLVLLGARPGHGKTLMGLELVVESIKGGNHAAFYSLEYTKVEVVELFADMGADAEVISDRLTVDTSDDICADYIIGRSRHTPRNTVVVIDYLQLLDQNRERPVLATQVSALSLFAKATGIIVIIISQIDRSFDPAVKPLPDVTDVRLPNALDLSLFTKTVFINDGIANLGEVG